MLERVKTYKKQFQRVHYTKKFNKVIPTPETHLQLDTGEYCTKQQFKNEFKIKYLPNLGREVKSKSAAMSTAIIFLDELLEVFFDDGYVNSIEDKLENYTDILYPCR